MKKNVLLTALIILTVTTLRAQNVASEAVDLILNEENSTSEMYFSEMYNSKFLVNPTLRIRLEPGSMKIDPAKIIPFGENGYLYPAKRLKGDWGKLNGNGYVFLSKDWTYLMLTIPRHLNSNEIQGDDWTMKMKDPYYMLRNQADNNFYLIKG